MTTRPEVPTVERKARALWKANDPGHRRDHKREDTYTMKKLLIGLTPLVAYVALMTVPVASQAVGCKKFLDGKVPHYCKDGVLIPEYPNVEPEKTPVVSWGTLSLGGTAGVTCTNVIGSNVWNPQAGGFAGQKYPFNAAIGAGEQETVTFNPYECHLPASACPLEARVIIENLPWPGITREGKEAGEKSATPGASTLRLQSNKVRVSVGCFVPLGLTIGAGKGTQEGEPACSSASNFECLVTSGGPITGEVTTPEHPGEGENAGKLKKGDQKCTKPGLVEFEGKTPGVNEGSGELEQEIPTAEAEGGPTAVPGSKPGKEGRGTLKFQTNPTDIRGPVAEPGVGTGVKAGTSGTLKACGFEKQELINTEE